MEETNMEIEVIQMNVKNTDPKNQFKSLIFFSFDLWNFVLMGPVEPFPSMILLIWVAEGTSIHWMPVMTQLGMNLNWVNIWFQLGNPFWKK